MQIQKQKKDAIEGMALYIEECMNEIRKQLEKVDVDTDIVLRRIAHATGVIDTMDTVVGDLTGRDNDPQ